MKETVSGCLLFKVIIYVNSETIISKLANAQIWEYLKSTVCSLGSELFSSFIILRWTDLPAPYESATLLPTQDLHSLVVGYSQLVITPLLQPQASSSNTKIYSYIFSIETAYEPASLFGYFS